MTTPTLPNLHDAVLEQLHVDWPNAQAMIQLTAVPGGAVHLTAHGIREVRVDRWEPWGPSAYVNSAEVHAPLSGDTRLRLEMQSGDTILVVANRIEVNARDEGDAPTTS